MRIWKIPEHDRERTRSLAAALGIPNFAAHLLINRGMTTEEECRAFLDTDKLPFVDPMLLPDMRKAALRVLEAVDSGGRVTVFGDYDVDGITATALLYSYLKEVGADVLYMLPSREEGGYGLNKEVIDRIKDNGTGLIITVDNGISAHAEIEYAASLGIDTVVTDHHKPPETLPCAAAVVDAFVPDGAGLPFREWAGVGAAFKLVCALENMRTSAMHTSAMHMCAIHKSAMHTSAESAGEDSETVGVRMAERYAELVALGSIADIVPLTGENRRLTALGISAMRTHPSVGTLALMRAAKVDPASIRAVDVSYSLAPRINSAGRMGSPYRALELLLCRDARRAAELAAELCGANAERSEQERMISAAVWDELQSSPGKIYERVTVACGKGWNTGIVGISAGRLCDALGRPVIVLAELDSDDEDASGEQTRAGTVARGSGRCFGGFSLYRSLTACADLLEAYGGHSQAAGLTIKTENIPEFERRINAIAAQYIDSGADGKESAPGEMPVQELECDCELHPGAVTASLIKECAVLEPFGACNPSPQIVLRSLTVDEIRPLSGGRHHRLAASRDGRGVTLLWFGSDAENMRYRVGDRIDCVVTADMDRYNGYERVKLTVRDIRPSGLDEERIIRETRLFERAMRREPVTAEEAALLRPSRQQIGDVYRLIFPGGYSGAKDILISRAAAHGIGCGKLLASVEAMRGVGLLRCRDMGSMWRISLVPGAERADPEKSEIITALDTIDN